MEVTVDTVPDIARRVDEGKTLGTNVAVPFPEGGEPDDDGLSDGPGLQHGLGGAGEPDGGVLQRDDVRLLDEPLEVLPVLKLPGTVDGEDLEYRDDVTGEVVLGGHPHPPLAPLQAGLQGMGVDEVHGPDVLVPAVEDGLATEDRVVAVLSDEGHLELDSLEVLDVPPLEELLPGGQVLAGEEGAAVHEDLEAL